MDHYEVLGLTPDATPNDVKKAFIARIKQTHPDKQVGGQDDSSRDVIRAYRVLIDEVSRNEYDARRQKDKGFKKGYVDRDLVITGQDGDFVLLSCNQCETENRVSRRVLQDFDSYECMSCNYNVFLAD